MKQKDRGTGHILNVLISRDTQGLLMLITVYNCMTVSITLYYHVAPPFIAAAVATFVFNNQPSFT
jgi:hypothetical protein